MVCVVVGVVCFCVFEVNMVLCVVCGVFVFVVAGVCCSCVNVFVACVLLYAVLSVLLRYMFVWCVSFCCC